MKKKSTYKILLTCMFLFKCITSFGQSVQTIRGKVIDEVTKSPLVGVTVVTQLEGGNVLGATTDVDGNYRLQNVPTGRQGIQISLIGYETQMLSNIVVTAGKEVILNVSLTEGITTLDAVEVVANSKEDRTAPNNELAVVSNRSFNVEDTKRYAGALGDPSRMAANFAGVVGGNDSRNDIVVRGNSSLGMLWQLEGMNVPNPNHFGALVSTGGPVSMLNNNNLDKSDFMTSAFPAQYGNATAAVFDLKLKDGNNEKREYLGQIGFNGFEAGAEGPFSKKSEASFIVNYRYSTLGIFKALGIQFGTGSNTPIYQDINFKISAPTRTGKFSFFGVGGTSSIDLLGSKADLTKNNDLYGNENQDTYPRYKTGIGGVSYESKLSEKTFAKVTLGLTGTEEHFTVDSLVRNPDNIVFEKYQQAAAKFQTRKTSLVFYTRTKFNAKNSLTSGIYVDAQRTTLFNQVFYANVNKDTIRTDVNDNTQLYQGYSTWKHRFTQGFSMLAGVHSQYYSLNKQIVVEPRASLQYQINGYHSLSIGYGVHNQIQNILTSFLQTKTATGYEFTNKDLGFTRSEHYVITYDWNITENIRIKAEAYYQKLNNVPVEKTPSSFSVLNTGASFAPAYKGNLVNNGTGSNTGIELTLERFFSKGFYFLVTTSLFDSKYKGSDGIERNTAFNTRYAFNALAGREWQVGRNRNFFSVSLKLTTIGGKYLTPLDIAKSQAAGKGIYQEAVAYTDRQPGYFRADLRFAYRKEYKKATMEVSLDLQNLTNHQNIFTQDYNPRTNSIGTQYQQSFFPVPYLRFTF